MPRKTLVEKNTAREISEWRRTIWPPCEIAPWRTSPRSPISGPKARLLRAPNKAPGRFQVPLDKSCVWPGADDLIRSDELRHESNQRTCRVCVCVCVWHVPHSVHWMWRMHDAMIWYVQRLARYGFLCALRLPTACALPSTTVHGITVACLPDAMPCRGASGVLSTYTIPLCYSLAPVWQSALLSTLLCTPWVTITTCNPQMVTYDYINN